MWPARSAMYWGARPLRLPRACWRLHAPRSETQIGSRPGKELLDRGWGKAPAFASIEGADPLEQDEVAAEIRVHRRGAGARTPSALTLPACVIVYAVVDDALSPDFPLGVELEVFIRREDAERFIEEVRGDEPEIAAKLRIEERELEAGGLN